MKPRTKIFLGCLGILMLFAAVCVAAHFRARFRLDAYRNSLLERGEKLSIRELIPPASTNGANGADALLQASAQFSDFNLMFSSIAMQNVSPGRARVAWQQKTLKTRNSTNAWEHLESELQSKSDALQQIHKALSNPVLEFKLDYQQVQSTSPIIELRKSISWLSAAVLVALHENRPLDAREHLQSCLNLVRLYDREPLLQSQSTRAFLGHVAIATTWEYIQFPGVRETDLKELQHFWESIDLSGHLESGIKLDQAYFSQELQNLRKSPNSASSAGALTDLVELGEEFVQSPTSGLNSFLQQYPGAWEWKWISSYNEELWAMQNMEAALNAIRAARVGRTYKETFQQLETASNHLQQTFSSRFRAGGGNGIGTLRRVISNVAALEQSRELVTTAIALQRFKLSNGAYPSNLTDLSPDFISKPGRDLFSERPLQYHLPTTNHFTLYSVGEDGEDNGGDGTIIRTNSYRRSWWRARDMVWPAPASDEEVTAYHERLVPEQIEYSRRYGGGR